ncbi:MAG: cobyrinic acid a,c-diamide synthase, partial [Lachnospiraceae bacterium]|nr:cobyrinic acid a,c-diamide synthase [Lachnospiraceae bacterium]
MQKKSFPRILIAAPQSGSGKTYLTCGLLRLLSGNGRRLHAFKCGPDFIDPLFHKQVLGIPSGNLDSFFTGEEHTLALFAKEAEGYDLSVMEGVMGY